jgi:hypothetical protein
MLDNDIEDLKYEDKNGTEISLDIHHRKLLLIFIEYHCVRLSKGTLQTDQGEAFGLQHEKDFNAQHIYASLEDYSVKSTEASLDASDGDIIEAVADASYIASIGLNTSPANVTKQHPGGPTIEVPVEDIPRVPMRKKVYGCSS